MLKRLRLKFILTNMLLVCLVLLTVFGALVLSHGRQLEEEAGAALEMALRKEGKDEESRPFEFGVSPGDRKGPGRGRIIPVFTVVVDRDGTVTASSSDQGTSVSQEVLTQAAQLAMATGQEEGVLSGLGLRFHLREVGHGQTKLAFSDLSWERASQIRLILNALLVGLLALVGFFLISLFLSRLALRPVERAWAQQNQFVADASHELKTPLTVILANLAILLSHQGRPEADDRKWLEYTRDEALRMKGLVEDLLFLAKQDAARLPAAQAVPFSDLVEGCLLRFEPVAFERGVTLEGRVAPELSVTGDRDGLERLVMILLDNAVKYAGERGRVALTLEGRQDKAVLTVVNSGPPIPADRLPHLFERFYRVDSSRSRDQGGYGLGLSIAQAVVQAHRGDIRAASDSHQGTVFTVTLPAKHQT